MIAFPSAKINLGLNIVERRPDGYHNLETIFYPIRLTDILEVITADSFDFSYSGIPIEGNPDDNLVLKAYRLFFRYSKVLPVKIHLHKVIPPGAGLGGGSSDGAKMLVMLNQLFRKNLTSGALEEMASSLGADCPFFINNTPVLATGTGTILTAVSLDLSFYQFVLVKPYLSINTSQAYKMIIPQKPTVPILEIINQPVETWKDTLSNDFEIPVFNLYPEIKRIKEMLCEMGAVYSSMTGSGSAVYGFFNELPNGLPEAFPGCFVYTQ